ncbi:flavodoxin [Lachnoclostridium phocaeense]|uniref:flavodoxin n=1 Tax=Lachnoclostridium phocaeense TaxID=1871021 RepID=UPI00248DFC01|nr:flavodoxin [Lachnoclostridium phocaeense]
MKAKKSFSMILTGVMAVSLLAGCSSEADSAQKNTSEETAQAGSQEETDTEDTAGGSSDNVLIVYYSATGNTEAVANYIADATGGTLFELEPAEPYTDEDLNYNDENSRVSREHEDESLQDVELVSTTVEGFDEYDTVFIGYPIWWGEAAWPVNQFVKNNDFPGKTVIPFATSASSGFGESGQLLADMAGTGDWQEGMRFGSSPDEAEVQEWIDGLGL